MKLLIKKNDNLGDIARFYNTTVEQIMADNPQIKDKDKIIAGEYIEIPMFGPVGEIGEWIKDKF